MGRVLERETKEFGIGKSGAARPLELSFFPLHRTCDGRDGCVWSCGYPRCTDVDVNKTNSLWVLDFI